MKTVLLWAPILLTSLATAQTPPRSKGPIVMINGNGDTSVVSTSAGSRVIATGSVSVSKHDQTIEMAQELLDHCPEITLVVKESNTTPDYELILNRADVDMFNDGVSQIMLLRASDKAVLFASKKRSVAKAVNSGCKAIMADWKLQHADPAAQGPWQIQKPEASK